MTKSYNPRDLFPAPHDDVIKWKHFRHYWPFVWGIHRSPVNSPHKGQWRGTLMFSLICSWTNGWVNIWYAGNLRRHRAHYDVTAMSVYYSAAVACSGTQYLDDVMKRKRFPHSLCVRNRLVTSGSPHRESVIRALDYVFVISLRKFDNQCSFRCLRHIKARVTSLLWPVIRISLSNSCMFGNLLHRLWQMATSYAV